MLGGDTAAPLVEGLPPLGAVCRDSKVIWRGALKSFHCGMHLAQRSLDIHRQVKVLPGPRSGRITWHVVVLYARGIGAAHLILIDWSRSLP